MLTFQDQDHACLKIEGAATIARVAEIRNLIVDAAAEVRHLDISFEQWPIDLAVLQLLISARRSAEASGGSVRLAEPPPAACLERLASCGLLAPGCKDEIWQTEAKR